VERPKRGGSKGKPSISRLLIVLILVVIIAPIIASFLFLYYLPSNDVEVTVYRSYPLTEEAGMELSYIVIRVNVTNNGIISHYVGLTGKVVFNSQPDEVYTYTSISYLPIDPGETLKGVRIYVDVPDEIVLDSYDASCSITLPSPVNEYNIGWIVPGALLWLVTLAFLSVTLVRSRRR
jgi:hypothetical protein